jgi:hypothetical protein
MGTATRGVDRLDRGLVSSMSKRVEPIGSIKDTRTGFDRRSREVRSGLVGLLIIYIYIIYLEIRYRSSCIYLQCQY